ncbi:PaaI family thioesterase [Natronomonas amylolytica]|uniref:PaaI family thioesterase n=1 Tax=Natronomonas amylolytica TaxID=3108498 RepID=UPI00300B1EE5
MEIERFFEQLPFVNFLGIEVVEADNGRAEGYLEMQDELSWNANEQMAHSGVTFTLAEVTGAAAMVSLNEPPVFTIDIDVKYLNTGYGDLYAEAEVVRNGDEVGIVEVDVVDEDQSRVVGATAVLALT